ncbi:MAG: hypothetical protein ACLFWF_14675 [Alphaproteobacteria bacterium]
MAMRGMSRAAGVLCLLALSACAGESKTVQLPGAAQATEAPKAEPGQGEADRWRSLVDSFIAAVRTRDYETLNRIRGREKTYDRKSIKDRQFYALLYSGKYVRSHHKDAHSVAELLDMGEMHAHLIDYDVNKVLIYFVPYAFIDELGTPDFLRKQWLRKYFSCVFAWEAGEWALADDCKANQITGRVARLN